MNTSRKPTSSSHLLTVSNITGYNVHNKRLFHTQNIQKYSSTFFYSSGLISLASFNVSLYDYFQFGKVEWKNMWVSYATLRGRTFYLTHWLLLNENPMLRTPETCTINFILDIDRRLNSFLMDRGSLQPHKEPISEYQMFFNPFWIHHSSSTLAFDCPQCHYQ